MSIDVNVAIRRFLKDDTQNVKRWKAKDYFVLFTENEEGVYRIYCMTGFAWVDPDYIVNNTEYCLPFQVQGDDLIKELSIKGFNCLLLDDQ